MFTGRYFAKRPEKNVIFPKITQNMKTANNDKQSPDYLELWEEDLVYRYPEKAYKDKEEYRNYDNPARDTVKEFYRVNHINQTYDFVLEKER